MGDHAIGADGLRNVFLSLDGKGEIEGTDRIESCCKGIDGVGLLDDN